MISYGRQSIDQSDIDAVVQVLRSDWLTQGPALERFERKVAAYCGAAKNFVDIDEDIIYKLNSTVLWSKR